MGIELTWISHASLRLAGETVIYIDPWKIPTQPHDGEVIFVSHEHYDHLSPEDIAAVSADRAVVLASVGAAAKLAGARIMAPGDEVEIAAASFQAVAAYNPAKKFHPPGLGGLGLIVTLAGKRVYYAGDTDVIDEMAHLGPIDLALLPVGGTYTMTAAEAVEACGIIRPALAVGYHWGDIVGGREDAESFSANAPCPTRLLTPGDSLTL